jgi:uncharacterized membrane protein
METILGILFLLPIGLVLGLWPGNMAGLIARSLFGDNAGTVLAGIFFVVCIGFFAYEWWYIVVPVVFVIAVIVAIIFIKIRKHKKNEETKNIEDGRRNAFETNVRTEKEKRKATEEKLWELWKDEEPNDADIIWFQPPTRRKTGTTKKATKNTKKTSKKSQTAEKSNDNLIYLLDGSNLLRREQDARGISLDVICSIIDYLKDHGLNYYVFFDANARHVLEENNKAELKRFDSLLKKDSSHFQLVPGGKPADDSLLHEAHENPNAIILTNDRYRDYSQKYPDVLSDSERRIQPMQFQIDGSIWFSGINLSIPMKRGSWNRSTKTKKS